MRRSNGSAKWATVPVINGLTDYSHPCQAMADLMTLEEHFGNLEGQDAGVHRRRQQRRPLAGRRRAGNSACGSSSPRPAGYELPQRGCRPDHGAGAGAGFRDRRTTRSKRCARRTSSTPTPGSAWARRRKRQQRIKDFAGFQVDEKLLASAPKHAVVLHCLPAYRGLEISDAVMEGPQSLVFPEAENRLHFQKGLMAVLMGGQ